MRKRTQCTRQRSEAVGDTLNSSQDIIRAFCDEFARDRLSNGAGHDGRSHAKDGQGGNEELGEEHG